MNSYTIICSHYTYGIMTQQADAAHVREECEKLKSLSKLVKENCYTQIEVVNNATGEVREYWNNTEDKTLF